MNEQPKTKHRPIVVDSHLDLAYNALLGYDPRVSLDEARDSEVGHKLRARGLTPTVTLPGLRAANARVIFGTLFVLPAKAASDLEGPGYTSADEAHATALRQLDWYRSLADDGLIRLIDSQAGLARAVEPESEPTPGVVLLMEGADPMRTPGEAGFWYEAGVRIVGTAWGGTRYSGGTNAPGPLTPAGRDLMAELDRYSMALDTSHIAEESFWQALRLFKGPVIASHSNCHRIVPTDRHLTDEMIRAIVDRDGVIGVVLYNRFLDGTWPADGRKSDVRLEAVVRHIDHICEIARDARHVGIGSDMDGGFGVEGIPDEMDSSADLPLIGQALMSAGWSADEAHGVLGGNWLRWLGLALPAI